MMLSIKINERNLKFGKLRVTSMEKDTRLDRILRNHEALFSIACHLQ
jgi:hypothetical protein